MGELLFRGSFFPAFPCTAGGSLGVRLTLGTLSPDEGGDPIREK